MVGMGCTAGGLDTCTTADKIRVYINNGTTFNENSTWEQNLTNLGYGSLAFGDIDNDGDLDLAVLGDKGGASGDVKIYTNNGTTFNENLTWESNLSNVDAYAGSLAFGDIDNDGDLDLALVGASPSSDNGIYINNGTSFVKDSIWLEAPSLVGHGLGMGSLAFGDIDNDGDLDLVFSGSYSTNFYDNIYRNNGTNLVGSLIGCDPCALWGWPSITLGDYDNDDDLDLAYMGTKTGDWFYIYNNTAGSFTQAQAIGDYFDGSIEFGDYDNDGDLDLAAMGKETGRDRIWKNNYSFFEIDTSASVDMQSDNMQQGSLAWIDVNNDTNIDLIINGKQGDTSTYLFKVYISNASLTKNNTKPTSPTSLNSTYSNNILILIWNNGSDAETNSTGLYYNLMIGNETANHTVVSGVYGGSSNPTAGYFGNMMQRKNITLTLELEANKTYNWYVQTIDTGLAKSNWSVIQSFNTSLDTTKPNITIENPSPSSGNHTNNPVFIFNASVSDANLTNVTLYANWTGAMIANETNSSGLNGSYVFTKDLTSYNDGQYSWYILANDSSNNSQTSGTRTFYLDREYPIVKLVSPADAGSWTSSSSVTFSYNVTDTDIANCSLIIGGVVSQTDTSVTEDTTQTFTKTLTNGNHNWYVNCSDYVGYTNNSATRSLTVSYTAPSNGGGGGGNGVITPSTIPKFDIDFATSSQGSFVVSQGDVKTFSFNSEVLHEFIISEIIGDSIRLIIRSEPVVLLIKTGETKQIDINKDGIDDLEIKLVSIISGKATFSFIKLDGADIVGREELEELVQKEALFDVKVSIVNLFDIIKSGRDVIAEIEVFNVNNIGQVDVVVDYYITNKDDNQTRLAEGSDTLAVEAVASFVRSLAVPYDTKSGKYLFNVDIKYGGVIMASSSAEFRVIRNYEIIAVAGIIILVVVAIFIYLWKIKKKETNLEKELKSLERKYKTNSPWKKLKRKMGVKNGSNKNR